MKKKIKQNWAEALKDTLLRYPVIIVTALVITGISQLIVLTQGYQQFANWYLGSIGWRLNEQKILNSLSASIDIGIFIEVLGNPLFVRTQNNLTEYSFWRKGYWIQAITNKDNSVIFYAITLCDDTFKPELPYNPVGNPVQLGTTVFNEVTDESAEVVTDYKLSVATANAYMIESTWFGNPSNYQTAFWGLNDVCSTFNYLNEKDKSYLIERSLETEKIDLSDQNIQEIRKNTRVNTFGVTAPFTDTQSIFSTYQVGVDRVLLRTAPNK